MICTNCKKTIDDDSEFCQFCGSEIKKIENTEKNELWEVFNELSFEQDKDKRQKNRQLIPPSIKEIIKRLSTNIFESLKEQNNSVLDLPYSVLKNIENSYYFLAEDGFWVYFAKNKLQGQETINLDNKDVKQLLKQLDEKFVKNKSKGKEEVSKNILETIFISRDIQVNYLLDNNEELKNLPARVIEKIRTDLILMSYWVYACCLLSERR